MRLLNIMTLLFKLRFVPNTICLNEDQAFVPNNMISLSISHQNDEFTAIKQSRVP